MKVFGATIWLLAVLVSWPNRLAAQAPEEPPRVSIAGGAGVAFPFHGDFDFTPWVWEADLRVRLARHLLLEVGVGDWRRTETSVMENVLLTPPLGLIGRYETKTTRFQRAFQVNGLFTAAAGRVRFAAGGGAGLLRHHRSTTQTTSNCSPGVTCGSHEFTFSSDSFSIQGVGGLDVRMAAGLAVYGQTRLIVPVEDPGGMDLRLTTGLRWGF